MKIEIMGFSGSGKSTLAQRLSEHYHLPVCYMDTLFWLPGWQMRSREEQIQLLAEFMDNNSDGWVIDGNYTKNLHERRMEEADVIIFMNYNRFLCLYRALKRNIMYQGKSRPSMTAGCDEKFDWPFIKWIFWESRTGEAKRKRQVILDTYDDKFVNIRSPRQLKSYLKTLGIQED